MVKMKTYTIEEVIASEIERGNSLAKVFGRDNHAPSFRLLQGQLFKDSEYELIIVKKKEVNNND